jgi:BASS family bile acid:Na+ symporter
MFEAFLEMDNIRLNFSPDSLKILNLTIAFIMFGVALELKGQHFRNLALNPKSAVIGAVSQFVLMPFMTFALAIAFRNYITPTIGLGMILVASCPGGNVSNFFSALARGNVALSVSLTAISDFGAIIITPFNFAFWGTLFTRVYALLSASDLVRPLEIPFMHVLQTIVILLGIPLTLGMLINHFFPGFTDKILIHVKRLSLLAFAAIIAVMFLKNWEYFVEYIRYIFVIVLIHNAVALSMGYGFASLFRRPFRDRKTISIETGIQNSGLALVLLFNPNIFPPELAIGGMAFIAAWWGLWHLLAGLTMGGIWSGFRLSPKPVATS